MIRFVILFMFIVIFGVLGSFAIIKIDSGNASISIKKHEELKQKLNKKTNLLNKIFQTDVKDKPTFSLPVTATGYSARVEECDATPEYTASMTPSRVGVIAVSNDLEKEIGLTMGQMVLVEGMGIFLVCRIEDRMNPRWKRRIDILHGNPKAAMLFGKKEVTITWIGKG